MIVLESSICRGKIAFLKGSWCSSPLKGGLLNESLDRMLVPKRLDYE